VRVLEPVSAGEVAQQEAADLAAGVRARMQEELDDLAR
jgi:hypothetical protein